MIWKQQRHINYQIKRPIGRAVLCITIDSPQGATTHTTYAAVEQACQDGLSKRFNLGQQAPINFGALDQDFGQIGHSHTSRSLFSGDYIFPADCDSATRDLLQGIAHIKHNSNTLIRQQTPLTRRTMSHSGSQLKKTLPHLEVGDTLDITKPSVTTPSWFNYTQLTLIQWQSGVTVLLEKTPGNTNLSKLRAIRLKSSLQVV